VQLDITDQIERATQLSTALATKSADGTLTLDIATDISARATLALLQTLNALANVQMAPRIHGYVTRRPYHGIDIVAVENEMLRIGRTLNIPQL
jgi:hypothetical protein